MACSERGHIVVGFSRTETTIENLFDERVSIAGGSQNGSANRQRFCWRRCDMGSDDSVRMAMIAAMEYLKRNRFPMFDLVRSALKALFLSFFLSCLPDV